MVEGQNTKVIRFKLPATVASDATSSTYFDRRGYNMAKVLVCCDEAPATNTSQKYTSLVVMHSPTTHISNATALSNGTGTTNTTASATQFVLPAHNDTANAQILQFNINCQMLERYIHVKLQASSSGIIIDNTAVLFRAEQAPDTATEAGTAAFVIMPT